MTVQAIPFINVTVQVSAGLRGELYWDRSGRLHFIKKLEECVYAAVHCQICEDMRCINNVIGVMKPYISTRKEVRAFECSETESALFTLYPAH